MRIEAWKKKGGGSVPQAQCVDDLKGGKNFGRDVEGGCGVGRGFCGLKVVSSERSERLRLGRSREYNFERYGMEDCERDFGFTTKYGSDE